MTTYVCYMLDGEEHIVPFRNEREASIFIDGLHANDRYDTLTFRYVYSQPIGTGKVPAAYDRTVEHMARERPEVDA